MTIADDILAIKAELDAVKTAIAAIPVTAVTATVDLSGVDAKLDAIAAELKPTPAA